MSPGHSKLLLISSNVLIVLASRVVIVCDAGSELLQTSSHSNCDQQERHSLYFPLLIGFHLFQHEQRW